MRYYSKKHFNISKIIIILFALIVIFSAFSLNTSTKSLNSSSLRSALILTIDGEINFINSQLLNNNDKSNLARLNELSKTKDTLLNSLNDDATISLLNDLEDASKQVQDIITLGYKYIGYPYEFGADGPNSFDCSSFVQYIYSNFNINLPRVTYDQVNIGKSIKQKNLKPGDLVFTEGTKEKPEHVGIYIGGGQMIHASKPGVGVVVGPVYNFVTARRVI